MNERRGGIIGPVESELLDLVLEFVAKHPDAGGLGCILLGVGARLVEEDLGFDEDEIIALLRSYMSIRPKLVVRE